MPDIVQPRAIFIRRAERLPPAARITGRSSTQWSRRASRKPVMKMSPSQLFRIEAHPFQAPPATRWDDTVALVSLLAFLGMIVFLVLR